MRKIISLILSAALLLSLAACGKTDTDTADTSSEANTIAVSDTDSEQEIQSGEELTGRVTAVDGSTVTIEVFSQSEMPEMNGGAQGNMPDMPENGENSGAASSDGSTEPPEMPEGGNSAGNQSEIPGGNGDENPPDKPDGESSNENSNDGQSAPPEMPSDEGNNASEMPEMGGDAMPSGESITITITDTSILYKSENNTEVQATLEDITVGAMLTITYDDNSEIIKIVIGTENDLGAGMNGMDNMGGGSADVIYGGTNEITSTAAEDGKTYASDESDVSALLISTSDDVTISNPTVTKSGDSDGGDNCNFYGQNAAVLVKDGSTTTITGGTITTDASGANGVFSYGGNGGQNGASGDGTTVIISDTVITTTGSGSGGIMTTGGGITNASNLTVTTSGQSSAAIRTDRGGGTVTVDGGTYTTNGLGSPAIYSTADITVSNASLISNLSEGVCIEGLNSIELNNCDLTANNTKCNGNATFYDTIMIYQSMSGDAASGTSSFTMSGGTLTSKNGHVFHITNTNAVVTLSEVTIINEDSENILLSVCDDGWSGGSNEATLNASKQELNGAILVGDNSTLTINLTDNSSFTGYISGKIKNANGDTVSTDVGTVSVTLDSSSTWTLTEDCYITSFTGDASNIISNGHTLYVNGVALNGTK